MKNISVFDLFVTTGQQQVVLPINSKILNVKHNYNIQIAICAFMYPKTATLTEVRIFEFVTDELCADNATFISSIMYDEKEYFLFEIHLT